MRSPGVIIKGYKSFEEMLQPLTVEISAAYWMLNVQSGPFDSRWIYESPENESKVDTKFLNVPELIDTSGSCWRPHTFPKLASHIIVDEETYFFAMCCSEDEARIRSGKLWDLLGESDEVFFEKLAALSDLFLCHIDGWWECYSPHEDWREKIMTTYQKSFERTWRLAFQPPSVRS